MSDILDLNHLQERSKGELIGLIEQMVARHPDLEKLVALPLLPSDITKTVDGNMIRQRVIEELPGFYYENSHDNLEAGDELKLIMRMGQQYMQAAEWANAVTVYESVAGELLDEYEDLHDEDGEVVEIINHCASQLGGCLAAIDTSYSTLRWQILMTLFDIYHKDVDIGGFDMGHEVPDIVLAQSTVQEKEMMTKHIRLEVSEGGNWARQALGGFLLRLEADTLDDETYLRLSREMGNTDKLIVRLLDLGRLDEAVVAAREVNVSDLLPLADLFVSHHHPTLAEQLVLERVSESNNGNLLYWLKTHAQEQGDFTKSLKFAKHLFWLRPSLEGYQELYQISTPLKQWDSLRSTLITRLTQANQFRLLTQIYLAENEIEQALTTLPKIESNLWMSDLSIDVAQAAEESHPREAMRLYLDKTNKLIERRGRQNYAEAATYLKRVRDLCITMGQKATWQRLIGDIHAENHRLSAMKDEFKKAGL